MAGQVTNMKQSVKYILHYHQTWAATLGSQWEYIHIKPQVRTDSLNTSHYRPWGSSTSISSSVFQPAARTVRHLAAEHLKQSACMLSPLTVLHSYDAMLLILISCFCCLQMLLNECDCGHPQPGKSCIVRFTFTYRSLNDTVHSSHYTASNSRRFKWIINLEWGWKKLPWPILRYYPNIWRDWKNLPQNFMTAGLQADLHKLEQACYWCLWGSRMTIFFVIYLKPIQHLKLG